MTDRPPLSAEHAETIDTAETLNGNLPPSASEVSGNCSYAGSDLNLPEQVRSFTTPMPKAEKTEKVKKSPQFSLASQKKKKPENCI